MAEKVLGRRPTLGDVLDYYAREDFLSFLMYMLQVHRVVTVIPRHLHWEPHWGRDEVQAADANGLHQYIVERITTQIPGTALD
jgi:hypothetical protein